MNKRIFLISILFILLTIAYTRSELRFIFFPEIDTTYATEFTHEKFESIKQDMDKDEVLDILGQPLYKSNNSCWHYSTDGKLWPYADFSYFDYVICFKDENVIIATVNEFNN